MEHRWVLCFGLLGAFVLGACDGATPEDAGTRGDAAADAASAGHCGDGIVDEGEQCDDGNDVAFDGCEPITCTFTCESDATCDDGNPCNGVETCNPETHACEAGEPPANGHECTASSIEDGVCRAGECVEAGCGNGVVDGTEECDDGNEVSGDGCENNCRFTCTLDEHCETYDVCDGTWSCDLETHRCVTTGPLDCDDDNPCTEDSCDPVEGCVHTLIDNDGDGHASIELGECGDDCDDDDPNTYPGAPELCGDPADNDCDPSTPSPTENLWFLDCDGDSYAASSQVSTMSCEEPPPQDGCRWTTRVPIAADPSTFDCHDGNPDMRPGQTRYFTDPHPCTGCTGDERFANYDCNDTVDKQYSTTSFNVSPTASCNLTMQKGLPTCTGLAGWTSETEPTCGHSGTYTSCNKLPDECIPNPKNPNACRRYTPVCVGPNPIGGPCYCPPKTTCEPTCTPGSEGCPWRLLRCSRTTVARTLGCR